MSPAHLITWVHILLVPLNSIGILNPFIRERLNKSKFLDTFNEYSAKVTGGEESDAQLRTPSQSPLSQFPVPSALKLQLVRAHMLPASVKLMCHDWC